MEKKKQEEDQWEELLVKIHQETSRMRDADPKGKIPPIFKKIKTEKIALPKDFKRSGMILEDAIVKRVSRREFKGNLSITEASKVLFYSNGFKNLVATDLGILQKTNAPSAGSRHPIEIYVFLQRVDGIEKGIYHYDNESHALEKIAEESQEKLSKALGEEKKKEFSDASMVMFLTAIHRRTSYKYGPRAYRFIHLDAGHIAQNAYLIGQAMSLSVCARGRWDEAAANDLLKIDGKKEFVVYALAMGRKA